MELLSVTTSSIKIFATVLSQPSMPKSSAKEKFKSNFCSHLFQLFKTFVNVLQKIVGDIWFYFYHCRNIFWNVSLHKAFYDTVSQCISTFFLHFKYKSSNETVEAANKVL